jgi:plastocyanin
MITLGRAALVLGLLAGAPVLARAQSLLERGPNVSGPWWVPVGVVQFNFSHRFSRGPAPERKIVGFPTFTLAAGLPWRTSAGLQYSTNSTVTTSYPNEWEFVGRVQPLVHADGAPLDVGMAASWNLAARGPAGELSLARDAGPARLLAVGRILADPDATGADAGVGGGAVLRLTPHVALAGDAFTLFERDAGERVAWSAGLHLAIPSSPHTLSLHLSNTSGTTMQSASRGGSATRAGFEFTIPFTLARYFGGGGGGGGGGGEAPTEVRRAAPALGDSVVVIHIANLKFGEAVEVKAGTTVEWVNDDPLAHTVTASDTSFRSGEIQPGRSFRHRFTEVGRHDYSCEPHPFMRGTVVVREGS